MNAADLQAVIRGIGPGIREYVAKAMTDFGTRLTMVEQRGEEESRAITALDLKLAQMALIPGPTGERGQPGEKGDQGVAGRDADPAEVAALKAELVTLQETLEHERSSFTDRVQMVVNESLLKLPAPKDGQDGTSVSVDDVLPILRAELHQAVAALPVAVNGRDGVDGRDGMNGTSVTVDDVLPVIRAEVHQAVVALPPAVNGRDGADGRSLTIEDVRPLISETVMTAVAALPPAKDGQDGQNGADGRDGADGRAVTLDELQPVVVQAVEGTLATWPRPKDAELPADLVACLEQVQRERAEQVSTSEVLATMSAILRKEWAPILSPPAPLTVVKRVIRSGDGRIAGIEETRQ